ncbi:putative LTR copia-type gag-polypeptide [Tanacetum coccineum]
MAIGDPSGSGYADLINNLDDGSPLHMNSNDSTSTSLIPFKLIRTKNYRIWSSAMKLALQARNKFAFVNGSYVKSTYVSYNVLSAQWDRCNVVVLTWIMNSVSGDVYMGLVYSVDADAVWKGLESTYDKEKSHRGVPDSSSVTESKLNATSFAAKSSNNFKRVSKGKGLLGPNGGSGGSVEDKVRGGCGSVGGNGGSEGSMARRGRGSLAKRSMDSKEGLVGAGGGEVKGGGIDFEVSKSLLGEIPKVSIAEGGGEPLETMEEPFGNRLG